MTTGRFAPSQGERGTGAVSSLGRHTTHLANYPFSKCGTTWFPELQVSPLGLFQK